MIYTGHANKIISKPADIIRHHIRLNVVTLSKIITITLLRVWKKSDLINIRMYIKNINTLIPLVNQMSGKSRRSYILYIVTIDKSVSI